jgi:hypothetical protein
MEKLESFYRRMRPFGFWGPVRARCPDVPPPESIKVQFALVASLISVVWGGIFAAIGLLLTYYQMVVICMVFIGLGLFGTKYFTEKLYPKGWKEEDIDYDKLYG